MRIYMKFKYKKLMFGLLAGALALAGCSKSNDDNVLKMNSYTEPPTLNPGLVSDTSSANIVRQIFEGLMTLDKSGKLINGVADSYSLSNNGLTYTIKLRKDAKWSNGDAVTAQDFEYAWKWILDPKHNSVVAYQLYVIKNAKNYYEGKAKKDDIGVKSIDDKTLEVTLKNPTPYFLELLARATYFPVNAKIALSNPDWAKNAGENFISNGPFKLIEWKHNNRITLEKNDKYWDADSVHLKKVEFTMINDANTELQMFRNGELDWAGQPASMLPLEAIPSLRKSGDLNTRPIAGIYWIAFNVKKVPFNNENIRKAFAYAINRKSIVDNVLKNNIPAMANVPPTMFDESKKGYFKDGDVKEAKVLLAKGLKELGLKSVDELPKIVYSYNTSDNHKKIAEALQDTWKKTLGISVSIENFEWKVYLDKMLRGEHQIARMGWAGDFNDPINFLELFEHAGGNNYSGWENKEFKSLLAKSRVERNVNKRREILKSADRLLIKEMPITPLYFYTFSWVKKDNLHDVVVGPLGELGLKYAYFD